MRCAESSDGEGSDGCICIHGGGRDVGFVHKTTHWYACERQLALVPVYKTINTSIGLGQDLD